MMPKTHIQMCQPPELETCSWHGYRKPEEDHVERNKDASLHIGYTALSRTGRHLNGTTPWCSGTFVMLGDKREPLGFPKDTGWNCHHMDDGTRWCWLRDSRGEQFLIERFAFLLQKLVEILSYLLYAPLGTFDEEMDENNSDSPILSIC